VDFEETNQMIKPFTRKQHYLILLLLLVITILPRLPFVGPFLYNGDPTAYFLGAQGILQTGQYLIDGHISFWPVGTSLTMVPFVWLAENVFQTAGEAGAFWHGVFFIYIAVAFTYLLGKRLFSPLVGILGAILLSLAESPFWHSVNANSDTAALAILVMGIYFLLLFLDTQTPRDLFAAFFLLALTVVFRWNYIFFMPLYLLYLVGDRRIWAFTLYPKFWILSGVAFLAGLFPQFWVNTTQTGNPFLIGYAQLGFSDQFSWNPLTWLVNGVRIVYRVIFTWDFYSPTLAAFSFLTIIHTMRQQRRDILMLFVPWVILGSLSVIYFGVKPRLLMPIMPPLFLLGAAGIEQLYGYLREVISRDSFPSRYLIPAYGLVILLLFTPMASRSLLMTYGNFQDKKVMQQAFRWTGEMASLETTILTQSIYAGQNNDWLRAGWKVWASRYYADHELASLSLPERWPDETERWVVINRFWFEGENAMFEDTEAMSARFDSLRQVWKLRKVKEFQGNAEPVWLKKLNMLSFYPVDFIVYRPRFEVWTNAVNE